LQAWRKRLGNAVCPIFVQRSHALGILGNASPGGGKNACVSAVIDDLS
jgi:hypothetical protein